MMDAFCSHIFDYACLWRKAYIAIEEARNYGKSCTSKAFSKMAGGRMHTPSPTHLDSPVAIIYKNHQISLAYLCHLAPLYLFFFAKRQSHAFPKYAPGSTRSIS